MIKYVISNQHKTVAIWSTVDLRAYFVARTFGIGSAKVFDDRYRIATCISIGVHVDVPTKTWQRISLYNHTIKLESTNNVNNILILISNYLECHQINYYNFRDPHECVNFVQKDSEMKQEIDSSSSSLLRAYIQLENR